MSGYEDYTRVSALYDDTRQPLGVEVILGCLANGPRPLGDVVLVDAGCGTGSYSRALVSRVARIEAVDLNAGMLDRAREKLKVEVKEGRIVFHQGAIDTIPLADASADGVMVNQVLHHLNDAAADGWPTTRRVMEEFARVLRPDGIVSINICSQEQITHGFWYVSLIPEAAAQTRARHIPLETLRALMTDSSLIHTGSFVPVEGVMQGRHYFDGRGPLDERWRAGDSIWALVPPAQLEGVTQRIKALDEAGDLDEFVAANDARRSSIGQFTFVCARKRAD
jgi:SAM-dependent methyltransferase